MNASKILASAKNDIQTSTINTSDTPASKDEILDVVKAMVAELKVTDTSNWAFRPSVKINWDEVDLLQDTRNTKWSDYTQSFPTEIAVEDRIAPATFKVDRTQLYTEFDAVKPAYWTATWNSDPACSEGVECSDPVEDRLDQMEQAFNDRLAAMELKMLGMMGRLNAAESNNADLTRRVHYLTNELNRVNEQVAPVVYERQETMRKEREKVSKLWDEFVTKVYDPAPYVEMSKSAYYGTGTTTSIGTITQTSGTDARVGDMYYNYNKLGGALSNLATTAGCSVRLSGEPQAMVGAVTIAFDGQVSTSSGSRAARFNL